MIRNPAYILLTAFFFLIPVINISGQEDDSVKTYTLEETVITGTRIGLEKNRLPVNITVINESEVEKSLEHNVLPLINNSVPGLFLNERNILGYGVGPVSSGEMSIRGIGESPNTGVLVLVDGQPQFMGIFGHPINDSYLRDNIERIEVIRGPASLLYGSNAFGGAVNIITRKKYWQPGVSFNGSASYGSFGTSVFSGSAGYNFEKLNLAASASHSQTEGHREDGDDGFKSNFASVKASYMIDQISDISIDADITDSRFFDPGPESLPRKNNYYDYLRARGALSFEASTGSRPPMRIIDEMNFGLKFFYNYGDHDFFDGWKSTDDLFGISAYIHLKLSEHNFTVGTDYKNYGGIGRNENVPPFAAIGLNKNLAVKELEGYFLYQGVYFKILNLSAGLRLSGHSEFNPDDHQEIVPQFGFSIPIDEYLVIKGNAGKSFRYPTPADFFLFPVSNEELEPERLWTYEAGISGILFDYFLESELTFFYIDADNIIRQLPAGRGLRKFNSGSFNNKGIEFVLSLLPVYSFSAALNYSYLHTSTRLPYAPEQKLNLHLEYQYDIFTISSDIQSIINLYPEGGIQQTDYTTFSLSVASRLSDAVSLFIKGNNLTDKKFYIDEGYPSPGINFIGGIRASL